MTTPTWIDRLPDLPEPPAFDGSPTLQEAYSQAAGLDSDRAMMQQVTRQTALRETQLHNAARLLERLPDPDEMLHIVQRGNSDHFGYVRRAIELCGCPVDHMRVATLSFSKPNAAELIGMLDRGDVRRLSMLCSCYFRAQNREIFDALAVPMLERGQRVLAARSHCKIVLIAAGQRRIVIEGSANLRACRNLEQVTVTDSLAVHSFHAAWIDELLLKGAQQP